jgi:hypothetical protein
MKSKAKNILIDTSKLVDKKFHAQRQLIKFHGFMEHHEYGLALDSLIELSDEVEDWFIYGFWLNLEKAADLMGLTHTQEIIKDKFRISGLMKQRIFHLSRRKLKPKFIT